MHGLGLLTVSIVMALTGCGTDLPLPATLELPETIDGMAVVACIDDPATLCVEYPDGYQERVNSIIN